MGMLKSIELENYKCFKGSGKIEIKPLTVLCGANSSGKSSILKSLLMLKQSYETNNPYNGLTFNGEYADMGFFDDIIFKGVDQSSEGSDDFFIIKNSFTITGNNNSNVYNPIKTQDITSYRELKKAYRKLWNTEVFEMEITLIIENPHKTSKSIDDRDTLYFIESNLIYCTEITIAPKSKNGDNTNEEPTYIKIQKAKSKNERTYDITTRRIPNSKGEFSDNTFSCTCYFVNTHLSNIYLKNMNEEINSIRPMLLSICNIAAMQYSGLYFIAPLRNHPRRSYMIDKNVTSVGIAGEDTPVLLAKILNKQIFTDIYCKNGITNNKGSFQKMTYQEILQGWMDYLEMGKLEMLTQNNMISLNISNHNIADVGFGVSQALPILVQGIFLAKEQGLLLEQPEIHLHPKMQLQMADFLINLAVHDRNVIVETHSDHIVNRVVRRVMEDYTLNEYINILFVTQDENGESKVNKIDIDRCRGTKDLYPDFFTQYGSETSEIVDIGFQNMMENT